MGKWQLQKARSCNFCLKSRIWRPARWTDVSLTMKPGTTSLHALQRHFGQQRWKHEELQQLWVRKWWKMSGQSVFGRATESPAFEVYTIRWHCCSDRLARVRCRNAGGIWCQTTHSDGRTVWLSGVQMLLRKVRVGRVSQSWRLGCPCERISKYTWCQTVGNLGSFYFWYMAVSLLHKKHEGGKASLLSYMLAWNILHFHLWMSHSGPRPSHPLGAYYVFPDLSAFGGADGSLVTCSDLRAQCLLMLRNLQFQRLRKIGTLRTGILPSLGLTHLGELEMWWAWKAKYLLDEHHIALVDGGRSMGKSKSQTLHSPCKLAPSRRVWRTRSGSCANSLLLFHGGAFPTLEIEKSIPATLVVCFRSESLHESSKTCRLLTDVKFAPGIWNSTSWIEPPVLTPQSPQLYLKALAFVSLSIWVTLNVFDDLMYIDIDIDIDIDIVWHICSGMSPWSWAAPPCPRQLERWPGSPGGLQVTDNGASIHYIVLYMSVFGVSTGKTGIFVLCLIWTFGGWTFKWRTCVASLNLLVFIVRDMCDANIMTLNVARKVLGLREIALLVAPKETLSCLVV